MALKEVLTWYLLMLGIFSCFLFLHLPLTWLRCLPGSEGGGVFNTNGELIGVCWLSLEFIVLPESNFDFTACCASLDVSKNSIDKQCKLTIG